MVNRRPNATQRPSPHDLTISMGGSDSGYLSAGLGWLRVPDHPWTRVMGVWALALALLIGLPVLGAMLCDYDLEPLLSFPPVPERDRHLPFNAYLFASGATLFGATLLAWTLHVSRIDGTRARARGSFPWWGCCSAMLLVGMWTLAWTRFDWFEPFQRHTFAPLWIAYIGVVNALTFWRVGDCLLTGRPRYLLILFPLSACFWWFFEYLNRYVRNWYYIGVEAFTPIEYAAYASVAFSTVLPAVMSTAEWLGTYPRIDEACKRFPSWRVIRARRAGLISLASAGACLLGLAGWPDLLFPAIWVAPGIVILGLLALLQADNPISRMSQGDWRPVLIPAMAGSSCGVLWELWNFGSLAHWEYSIPLVDGYHLFEMPILGYAGYLPFGVECMIVATLLPRGLAR